MYNSHTKEESDAEGDADEDYEDRKKLEVRKGGLWEVNQDLFWKVIAVFALRTKSGSD